MLSQLKKCAVSLAVTLFNYVSYSWVLALESAPFFHPVVIQVGREEIKQSPNITNEVFKGFHNINIVGDEFVLDGNPLQIASGSMHYFRLPAEYWQDRLRKLRAAGLNSVSTYVEWSYHEPEERMYSFEGDRDIVRFIQLAAEEGLHVILRPGPYICAERDLGGLPYWLLGKYPNIKLRTTDKDFIQETKLWINKLFKRITPLLYGNGGPIILVQVENEYGTIDNDTEYKAQMYNIFREHVGNAALLFTTDGAGYQLIAAGAIPNTLTTVDFEPPSEFFDVDDAFISLRKFMPQGPLMNSEFYSGWLTHWGERFQRGFTRAIINCLRILLERKINFNIYMFFGGTNFEFTSGANHYKTYRPDITSYDYDAPLTEAGDPTAKYFAIRELLYTFGFEAKHLPAPEDSLKAAYGSWPVHKQFGLLTTKGRSTLGKRYSDRNGPILPTFEILRQRSGLILYETELHENGQGLLQIQEPRDRVYVYVNNEFAGVICRMKENHSLPITSKSNCSLSLLVKNQGRINYGTRIQTHDYKGLKSVLYNNVTLSGRWSITGYPLQYLPQAVKDDLQEMKSGPVVYEGTFTLPAGLELLDTYLDTTGWGKGYIWVNSHNLGRYWPDVGPQVTLYLPGVWLLAAPAINRIQVLELEKSLPPPEIQSIGYSILNKHTVSSVY